MVWCTCDLLFDQKLWEVQDFAESERRQLSVELQQAKASNVQLQERVKSKSKAGMYAVMVIHVCCTT